MKKIAFLSLVLAVTLLLPAGLVYADSSLKPVDITQATFNMENPDEEPVETNVPIANWCKVLINDKTEATLLTDGTINDILVDAEGDRLKSFYGYDAVALNCWLSTPIKRDDTVKLASSSEYVWDGGLNNYWFAAYDVNGNTVGNLKYPADTILSIPGNLVFCLNATVIDPDMGMPVIVANTSYDDSVDNDPDYLYVHFEYGLEEKEVIEAIDGLPEAANIKISDESAINSARALYNGLEKWKTTEPSDPDIQNKVTNYTKLVDCENALSKLKEEEGAKETAKTDARAALDTADALNEADYTTDSYKTVKEAKAALEAILAEEDATSTEIKEATAALNDAISKLEKKAPVVTKKKQPMTVKAVLKSVSFKALKKAKKIVKGALVIKKNQGKVTYKKLSGSKKLTINKTTGKITVKKGTKKGLYKIRVKVTAKGNAKYKAGSKNVTVKIRVK